MKVLPNPSLISRWNAEIDMKAIAPHLLLSDTNPKLAFHLASSFSQTAIPGVVFLLISKQRALIQLDLTVMKVLPNPSLNSRWNAKIHKITAAGWTPLSPKSLLFRNWAKVADWCMCFFKVYNHLNSWSLLSSEGLSFLCWNLTSTCQRD